MVRLNYRVVVSAFYGLAGSSTNWGSGILVLPGGQDAYGSDVIAAHASHVSANLVITLMDAWVLDRAQIRGIVDSGIPVLCWCPVDCAPLGIPDETFFRETGARVLAMSRFGQEEFLKAGIPALYAPHGIDTQIFKPPEDRLALRKRFNLNGRFVVSISNANKDQVRKAFSEQMEAFARFSRKHPEANALLSMHTLRAAPTGLNLMRMAEKKGIADRIAFNDNYAITIGGISQPMLAEWLAASDVGMCRSYGEGFGLAAVEFQACGTPIITGDFSAMKELCGAGWVVTGQSFYNEHHGSDWSVPLIDYTCPECGHADGLVAALELAYKAWKSGEMPALREKAREFALAYDADLVLEQYWKPVLAEIEALAQGSPVTLHPQDRDRDAALARIQDAFNAGHLDAEEFGRRAQQALAATGDDLAALVADLPEQAVAA